MATPQPECTKKEQRAMTWFLWSEGVSGAEIHRKLLLQYEDSILHRTSVYKWIEKFKSGRTSVMRKVGAGRPSTSISSGGWRASCSLSAHHICQATFKIFYPLKVGFHWGNTATCSMRFEGRRVERAQRATSENDRKRLWRRFLSFL